MFGGQSPCSIPRWIHVPGTMVDTRPSKNNPMPNTAASIIPSARLRAKS